MSVRIKIGNLTFIFRPGVSASQYDEWQFYKKQFQNGCAKSNKAVDIVAYEPKMRWLIEVKDYRKAATPVIKEFWELGEQVAQKCRDTLAGLVAASVGASEPGEKTFATDFIRLKTRIRVVLHLELPPPHGLWNPFKYRADLQSSLSSLLKAIDSGPLVVY